MKVPRRLSAGGNGWAASLSADISTVCISNAIASLARILKASSDANNVSNWAGDNSKSIPVILLARLGLIWTICKINWNIIFLQ